MNTTRRTFLGLTLAASGGLLITGCQRNASALPPDVEYYTCSMHTFVRAKAPGKCPVCGMDLIPVMKNSAAPAVHATEQAGFIVPLDRQQQIGVTYAKVEMKRLSRTIRATGSVEADRGKEWQYVARTAGYVKKLFVTSPGEIVSTGQPLLSIYSPDLFAAEREYALLADDDMRASARLRLKQWNVSDEDIAEIDKTRRPQQEITLRSPFPGVIKLVSAEQGGSVAIGDKLVEVADLSSVWVWADFYESEAGALQPGQKATVTLDAYPGETFEGSVALINPFLDQGMRTFKARIDLANPGLKFRPGMYAEVALQLDVCHDLAIPVNAVFPTGTRNFVFVDQGNGRLEPRSVTLGPDCNGSYQVKNGLTKGESVVASAVFLIDAEAQIQGALKSFDPEAKP